LLPFSSASILQQNKSTARRSGFKKGVEHEDARRRRTETTIQLRKEKKEDQIQKRRNVSSCQSFSLAIMPYDDFPIS
jgi:ribulose bisphosphate carboxylase small subunit